MTTAQEQAITLALNVLHVGFFEFFECPRHDYQYFISNDKWARLITAAGVNAVDARRRRWHWRCSGTRWRRTASSPR